jgi:hypothetical protein
MSSVGPLLLLSVLAAGGVVAWRSYVRRQRRAEGLALFAFQNGLEYSRVDPFGMADYPFRLFGKGDGRGCENVLWGPWHGAEVKAADYWYYTTTTDSQGHTHRHHKRFSIALVDIEAFLPGVLIQRESLADTLTGLLGFRDIQFESERFNRLFQVRTADLEFAYRLIDARMMRWLLDTKGRFGFEVAGSSVLVYCPPRRPTDLIPLLGTARAFRDHIPGMVLAEYGT